MVGFMPEKTQRDWRFAHVMTTMFTCRSVVKYSSILSNEQRQELIGDIDQSLQLLRGGFISISSPQVQEQPVQHFVTKEASSSFSALEEKGISDERERLYVLYRTYHAYRDSDQNKRGDSFVSRFTNAMAALSNIQTALEQCRVPGIADARPLDYVCAFIADLYYVFVEFIRSLSEILETNDVLIETEQLSLRQATLAHSEALRDARHLDLLYRIYESQQCLNSRYGPINRRVQEAQAFLTFLEKTMCSDVNEHEEFMLQFSYVSGLLSDLAVLVDDYERATSILLR
jgi:hypothetical protein